MKNDFLIISNMFKSITNITLPECLENYDPSKEIESFWNEFSKSLYGWPSALENYEYAYKFDEQDIDTIIKNIKKVTTYLGALGCGYLGHGYIASISHTLKEIESDFSKVNDFISKITQPFEIAKVNFECKKNFAGKTHIKIQKLLKIIPDGENKKQIYKISLLIEEIILNISDVSFSLETISNSVNRLNGQIKTINNTYNNLIEYFNKENKKDIFTRNYRQCMVYFSDLTNKLNLFSYDYKSFNKNNILIIL
ncbi:hypothetical protein LGZ99_01295 [Photorhabdus temperata]|uniref:Uncharacterized protein n=1 Tax=Photorhabdus temperata subsp. temperata Meg1 TaxID=1393735 RepID=A0A081RTS3_PHOTE|nr:hypothetical protein [Photorhabdus temperata]KER02076.1 hypothetical protein MEG1DRAFT_03290 [Photorhabdus temperata subsp. temperata Meg1]MCT8345889.1 hypothetical protein [Photorhabdus temperata]